MNMKKIAIVMTALIAVTALASCRRGGRDDSSSTSGSQTTGSQTSTSGQPQNDWSEESKAVFAENLLFSLPYIQGAEAEAEGGIVVAVGTNKATSNDVDKYCEALEGYVEEWEEEEEGTVYKMRCTVTAMPEVSSDADYYFGLASAAEYRLNIEMFDEEYGEWATAYLVQQVVYFGLSSQNTLSVFSTLYYDIYSAVFGVSFDGTSGYMKTIYPYFDTNDTTQKLNINTYPQYEFMSADGKKTTYDGEFITPEFGSEEEYAMVLPIDYQYAWPFLYGCAENPVFSTYLGLVYGSETEHDDYIDDLLLKGYVEVDDPERVIEGERLFELETAKGYCEISVDDYSDEQYEFELGTLPGYGCTFTYYQEAL